MKMQSSPIRDGALQVTTPAPTFKPVTVELTFESLEELLAIRTALVIPNTRMILEELDNSSTKYNEESIRKTINEHYNFFNEIYQLNK